MKLLLDSVDVIYVTEFSFPDLLSSSGRALRFDYALFHSSEDLEAERPCMLIELHGRQHYEKRYQSLQQFEDQKSRDKKKKLYCEAKRIPLVIIPYTDYHSMNIEEILEKGKFFE